MRAQLLVGNEDVDAPVLLSPFGRVIGRDRIAGPKPHHRDAVRGNLAALDQLRREVAKLTRGSTTLRDWPLFRGDAGRSARGQGDAPFLEPRWSAATITHPEAKTLLDNALKFLRGWIMVDLVKK